LKLRWQFGLRWAATTRSYVESNWPFRQCRIWLQDCPLAHVRQK